MIFLQPTTTCCNYRQLFRNLNKPSRSLRLPFTQRRLTPARHRHSNLHSDERLLHNLGAVSNESETSPVHEENASNFDWFKNWWVVDAVVNLKTDRPNKVKLLNRDFVFWNGHNGEWIAMDEKCPHRLAPLSEGRIEKDGNLLCSYHAWRFSESGKCVKIPHAEDEKAHSVACNSPRSAVQTYPCKAFSAAENTSIPIDDDLADYVERAHEEGVCFPFVMQFPVSFESLMENVMDVSHIQVTHHGVSPMLNRYQAAPIHAKVDEQISEDQGIFTLKYSNTISQTAGIKEFKIPGTWTFYDEESEEYCPIRSYLTGTPITATRTLLVVIQILESQILSRKKANIFQKALSPFLNMMHHFFALQIGDADIAILTKQDKKIKAEGFEFEKDFYLPTNADVLVSAFRKWFETEGQRGAAYRGNKPINANKQLSREEAMNRFEQHTKHSKLCSSALKITETILSVLRFVRNAAACVVGAFLLKAADAGSVALASTMKNVPAIVSVLVLCCSIAAIHMLKKLRSKFYYVGYDFHEKN